MALGDGTGWDESTPNNNTNVSDGDDHIKDLRIGVRIRLEKEHVIPATSSAGGEHKFVTLQTQASKPTLAGSQIAAVYAKDVSGTKELFYENSAGTETQLTSGGAINISLVGVYSTGHLYGGILSNNGSDATNDLDITACYARSSDDSANIATAALTKRVDATWVAGTGNGGLDTGTIGAVGVWVYIWAIGDGSSLNDILFSKSSSAPTMPASYTKKRLIGARRWSGSAWLTFKSYGTGVERKVVYNSWQTAVNGGSPSAWTSFSTSTYVPAATSTRTFGSVGPTAGTNSAGGITNDSSVTHTYNQRNSFWYGISAGTAGQPTLQGMWDLDILTADTLYYGGNGTVYVFIAGYVENL